MFLGTAEKDITPRIGVELSGFGPYLHRYSIGVRSPLMAKAFAFEQNGKRALLINCELIGIDEAMIATAEKKIMETVNNLSSEDILFCCTHTHSGPATVKLFGWGECDPLYKERLPDRLAEVGIEAFERLEKVTMSYGKAPCEHIGLNRERDKDAPPLEDVLKKDWRPALPQYTDTEVQVLKFTRVDGSPAAFAAYFGCHPVVCCSSTRYIHGDFPAIALVYLEQEFPGATGIFLQGAQGDVNSCVVHKQEEESLRALDVIAARFAVSIREALSIAKEVKADKLLTVKKLVTISTRHNFDPAKLHDLEAKYLKEVHDAPDELAARMPMVYLASIRNIISKFKNEPDYKTRVFLSGIRFGDVELLAAPFEIMQMIKNEIVEKASAPLPLVLGLSNGIRGYAPDKEIATKKEGSYTTDVVPMLTGEPPFEDIHGELVRELLAIDIELRNLI